MKNTKAWMSSLLLAGVIVFGVAGCGQASNTPNDTTSQNSSGPSANGTGNAVNMNGAIRQGNTLIVGAGNYAGSNNLSKYEAAAKSDSKNVQAQIDAAISAHVNGNNQLAVQYYTKAIQLDPKNGVALTSLGNIYAQQMNQPTKALDYYQKSVTGDPSYGWGWYQLANVQNQTGKKSDAKATLQKALTQVKSSDPAYKAIQLLSKQLSK